MSTVQYRMLAPVGGGDTTINGRRYTAAHDAYLDVPDFDARILQGWINCGLSGTTANRPLNQPATTKYLDTSLSALVVADGQGNWRNPFTGAVV